MSARILVDATAVPADRGGVGRYVDEVVAGMAADGADLVVACQDRDLELFGRTAPSARLHGVGPRAQARPARMAWEQVGLPRLLGRTRSRVLWSPHYTTAYATAARRRVPAVVTLHDATFFSDPEVHTAGKGRFFRAATKVAVRAAARCVVPSAATRDEVVHWAGGAPDRIDVIPHGVDLDVFSPAAPERVRALRERLALQEPFVAFLGTLEPRKNVVSLVRAWQRVCERRDEPPTLVLAGGKGWDAELDATVAAVPARLRLLRTGYLPVDELAPLLTGADVVAYPSRGEGFGLPVLEAMACGAAVLTTRCLALPEVGGDAVAYSETSATSIAGALADLLDDVPERRRLSAAAVARAGEFTWERSATAHRRVLEEVAR